MSKAALGKGMKDLIAKNFGISEKKDPSKERSNTLEELKVNISRYQAQGLNVEPLKELEGKDQKEVAKGIEHYRNSVKVLGTAQTIVRTLEGYGYTQEIQAINDHIKDPTKATEVLIAVEELKDRAQTEHNIQSKPKEMPGRKLSESLKEKSQILKGKGEEGTIQIDESSLDSLLDDLNDISDAFSTPPEDDPLMIKVHEWEELGYFVDSLKNSLNTDRNLAEKEIEQFEKDIQKMESTKRRFSEMDFTGFHKESDEIMIKFQYPYLSKEIENELDHIESMKKKAEKFIDGETGEKVEIQEETGNDEETVQPEESVETEPPQQEEKPEAVEVESPEEEEEKEPPSEEYANFSSDELMEIAKESYKEGKLEESLTQFKEILKKDPDSSKARFMIRRISSKL